MEPLNHTVLRFSYQDPEPWQTGGYERHGLIQCSPSTFFREDTISDENKHYTTRTEYNPEALLIRNYWSEDIGNVTENRLVEFPLTVARYTPILLLNHAHSLQIQTDIKTEPGFALYEFALNDKTIHLHIRRSDYLLEKVTCIWHDDMLGDMAEVYLYSNFITLGNLHVPQSIRIEKIHDIREEVEVKAAEITNEAIPLLKKPAGYRIEQEEEIAPETHIEKLSENIHLINLPQTESRAVVVEFREFLVVFDVPFGSENGELVLREIEHIAPGKPVRYFAFGHHHPWYLGGVRPFIYRGITVLSTEGDLDYVRYLATAPHSLAPDSLYLHPKALRTELVDSLMTITDGEYTMKLCHIGMRSDHTTDYIVFYFPKEKMLMHGDLAWIPTDGPVKKGGKREKGLYNAIKEFGLDVATIVQTWPVGGPYNVKNIYPVSDLEATIVEQE